jgi:GPH family glycoside/pentoside/hexuronide:cation symporter
MIPLRSKIGYGLGDMGISISYFTVSFFFIYYLTDIVKLPPSLAGLAFFIGQAWDSVNDPLFGVMSDRTISRFGRKRVYLLFGAMPFAVSFALLWLAPLASSYTVKFIFATLSLLLYATVYSVVTVPYLALVPVMTRDYDERTQITGIRAMLSTLGTILGGVAAVLVSRFPSELIGLRVMAISFGVFAGLTLLIAAQSVQGMESTEAGCPPISRAGLRQYLALMQDRTVFILMLFKFLGAVATGSLMASLPYFAKHILGDEGFSTIGLAVYIAIAAACVPAWNWLTHRFDKRKLLLGATSVAALVLFGIGLFIQAERATLFYLGCALLGVAMSAYLLIPYSLVPDLVEYYEHETGERHESVFFGLWITVHQFGIATAGLMLGLFLQFFGYDVNQAVQGAPALLAVRLALGLIPGVFIVLASLSLQPYAITRQVYQQIQVELEHSRLENAPGKAAVQEQV